MAGIFPEERVVEALLVVDVQVDFCPGGSLAVAGGDEVAPFINGIRDRYPLVLFTQDWHPAGHASFASSHPGRQPFDIIDLYGKPQTLWPDHCIQESPGAAFHPQLNVRPADPVVRKGQLREVDSYSGFLDNDRTHETGLREVLKQRGVDTITVAGIATDVCVKFTVLDARRYGLEVRVLRGGCRAVNLDPQDETKAYAEMEAAGAEIR